MFFFPFSVLGAAASSSAGLSSAALTRISYGADLFPRQESVNFWAYRQGISHYIPVEAISRILQAKLRRYDKKSSIVVVLGQGKTLEFIRDKPAINMGVESFTLARPVISSPDGEDLLVPMELLVSAAFKNYVDCEVQFEEEGGKIRVFKVQEIAPPSVQSRPREWVLDFKLPVSGEDYEITFHPLSSSASASGKIAGPYLAVGFPFSRAASASEASTRSKGEGALLSWSLEDEPEEKTLVFKFPLPDSVSFSDVEASESRWPSKRLKIRIAKEKIEARQGTDAFLGKKVSVPKDTEDKNAQRLKTPSLGSPAPSPGRVSGRASPASGDVRSRRPARRAPLAAKSSRRSGLSIRSNPRVIVVDPGHGGRDFGATNKWGVREKDISMSFAKTLEAALEKKIPDSRVYLTRSKDQTLDLPARVRFAGVKEADIFISLHANASKARNKGGFEIYIPASQWAPNGSPRALLKTSERLALAINNSLDRKIGPSVLRNRGIIKGDFYVLRENKTPSVLIEIGFLTHQRDYELLVNGDFRSRFVQAVADGIFDYLKHES